MEMPTAVEAQGNEAAARGPQLTATCDLPKDLSHKILALLPADERARAATTSRDWRALVAERSLWTRLNLSRGAGVTATINDVALRELDVSDCDMLSAAAICAVAAKNAATLRQVTDVCDASCLLFPEAEATFIPAGMSDTQLAALLQAAPNLATLSMDVNVIDVAGARAVLRNEPPFGPLRIRHLLADICGCDDAAVMPFAADLASHSSLCGLTLFNAPVASHAELEALVSAVIAHSSFTAFGLVDGQLPPAPERSLARLVAGCGVWRCTATAIASHQTSTAQRCWATHCETAR